MSEPSSTVPASELPRFKTEAEWYAWQNDPATRAVSDEDFWAHYALHFAPGKYGVLVRLEVDAGTASEAVAAIDAQLRRSRTFKGHRTGSSAEQLGLGDFKSPVGGNS